MVFSSSPARAGLVVALLELGYLSKKGGWYLVVTLVEQLSAGLFV